ncbi:MAG: hypothetical protein IAE80_30140, partial [Anaerolinea sp.]|nr:hypothetical protein [Anaerolinea sp.]
MRKVLGLLLLIVLAVSVVSAQDEAIVDGLNNPRALYFDDAGTLYIVEAGSGGDETADGAFGPVTIGDSSRIWTLEQNADAPTELVSGLLSMEYFQSFVGASDVAVTDDTIWVLLGQGPTDYTERRHTGLVGYDRTTLEETAFVDLLAFETENNPDNDDVAANPNDMA